MARKKAATVTRAGKDVVVVTPPASPPARRSPRRARAVTTKRRRRRATGPSLGGASFQNKMMAVGLGGLIYGFVEKQWPDMPEIPVVGKSGTIAIACYFFGPRSGIVRDIGLAAASIAGYTFGKTGEVSGGYGG
jgi:hypothetical protein